MFAPGSRLTRPVQPVRETVRSRKYPFTTSLSVTSSLPRTSKNCPWNGAPPSNAQLTVSLGSASVTRPVRAGMRSASDRARVRAPSFTSPGSKFPSACTPAGSAPPRSFPSIRCAICLAPSSSWSSLATFTLSANATWAVVESIARRERLYPREVSCKEPIAIQRAPTSLASSICTSSLIAPDCASACSFITRASCCRSTTRSAPSETSWAVSASSAMLARSADAPPRASIAAMASVRSLGGSAAAESAARQRRSVAPCCSALCMADPAEPEEAGTVPQDGLCAASGQPCALRMWEKVPDRPPGAPFRLSGG